MAVTVPRAPSIPEMEAPVISANPHLYESFKKIKIWMDQVSAGLKFPNDPALFLDGTGNFTAPNVDGGTP